MNEGKLKVDFSKLILLAVLCSNTLISARAADYTVPTDGTLNQGIINANAAASPYSIEFAADHTIAGNLTHATNHMSLAGDILPPGTLRTIDINGYSGIRFAGPSRTSSISNLHITGADLHREGAIYNDRHSLTINNSKLANNTAEYGAAVYNTGTGSNITVTFNNIFENNTASERGGSIYNTSGANINIQEGTKFLNTNGATNSEYGGAIYNNGANSNVTITGSKENKVIFNSLEADNNGGAIYNNQGTMAIRNTSFDSNVTVGGHATDDRSGGAIYNTGGGRLEIGEGTSFTNSKNFTNARSGGAISNVGNGSVLIIEGATNNKVTFNGLNASYGGAIYSNGTVNADIQNAIFDSNSALVYGGSIYNQSGGNITIREGTEFLNTKNVVSSTGGAIYNSNKDSTITIEGTDKNKVLFDGIRAAGRGGAIYNGGDETASSNTVLTISNATFDSNSGSSGGSIFNSSGGSVVVNEGTIFKNTKNIINASTDGGAITNMWEHAIVEINGTSNNKVIFEGLKSANGGAIYNAVAGAKTTVTNTIFNSNYAVYGGAIRNSDTGVLEINEGTIFKNTQNITNATNGGGIYNSGKDTGVTISGTPADKVHFEYLKASTSGGAIFNMGDGTSTSNTKITIENTRFISNSATNGGAIYNDRGGSVEVGTGTVFTNGEDNINATNGGAIYNSGMNSTVDITSSTPIPVFFFGMNASNGGGAIYNTGNGAKVNIDFAWFNSNTARYGGSVNNGYGGIVEISAGTQFLNTVGDKNAEYGGAIFNNNANSTITMTATATDRILFDGLKADYGGAIANIGDSKMNIGPNIDFTNNNATTSGGAIFNGTRATLNLTSDATGDIIFTGNTAVGTANDIGMSTSSVMNINGDAGKVILDGGVSSLNNTPLISKTGQGELLLTPNSDSTTYTGTFNQTEGTTTLMGKFFGGINTIADGVLNWFGGLDSKINTSELYVNGGTINIGGIYQSDPLNGYLDLNNSNDILTSNAVINLDNDSFIDNTAGDVTFNAGDTWNGHVINESTVTLDGFDKLGTSQGTFEQTVSTGVLNLINSSHFSTGPNSLVTDGTVNIGNGTTGSIMEVTSGTTMTQDVALNLDADNKIINSGGDLRMNGDNDVWEGEVELTGGLTVFDGFSSNGIIDATGGTAALNTGSLTVDTGSQIAQGVETQILSGTDLNIDGTGAVYLDAADIWEGDINLAGGDLVLDNLNKNSPAVLNQTGGNLTVQNGSNYYVGPETTISNGNVALIDSNMYLAPNSAFSPNDLAINSGMLSSFNGVLESYDGATLTVGPGTANFEVDIDGITAISDKFTFIDITGPGLINLSNIGLLRFPVQDIVTVTIFEATNSISPDVQFDTSISEVQAPVGTYKFVSLGDGRYQFRLDKKTITPPTYRGQVATLAAYQNQLVVNNLLLDHVYLDSNELIAGEMKNKYAAANSLLSPYQFNGEGGSIWAKTYATFEKLAMTHDLNVDNNAYGTVVMADFDVMHLANHWDFLPTAYISYNGGHQVYNGVSNYQNGGQAGFMGTFTRHRFIGQILAYAGGYYNEMSVGGVTDETGNWFAGTAAKVGYDWQVTRNFIIQPSLLASYNIFGKQNWTSDFGAVSMNSGFLNGINVAPGISFIYGRETWSLYLKALYMYNINEQVSGRVGDVTIPNLKMRHGYIEYGIGATKTWKERLLGHFEVVLRNGGRTGVGFQFGLSWRF